MACAHAPVRPNLARAKRPTAQLGEMALHLQNLDPMVTNDIEKTYRQRSVLGPSGEVRKIICRFFGRLDNVRHGLCPGQLCLGHSTRPLVSDINRCWADPSSLMQACDLLEALNEAGTIPKINRMPVHHTARLRFRLLVIENGEQQNGDPAPGFIKEDRPIGR